MRRYRVMGVRDRRRLHAPQGAGIVAAIAVLVTVVGLAMIGGFVFLETQLEPVGGAFGIPTRIPLCGRQFEASRDTARRYTLAEIEAAVAPERPIVLEPTIGELPVLGLFESHPTPPGMAACDTRIFLRVGPDSYLPYVLAGSG